MFAIAQANFVESRMCTWKTAWIFALIIYVGVVNSSDNRNGARANLCFFFPLITELTREDLRYYTASPLWIKIRLILFWLFWTAFLIMLILSISMYCCAFPYVTAMCWKDIICEDENDMDTRSAKWPEKHSKYLCANRMAVRVLTAEQSYLLFSTSIKEEEPCTERL